MAISVENTMSVRAAAQLLDVSEKQVQHLGRLGEVHYVARGLLDGSSVRAFQATRQGRHTRGWSGRTAWAAIALLSGGNAAWLGQGQTSRLSSRLRDIDSSALVAAARNRALIGRFSGHAAAAERLSREPGVVPRRILTGLVGSYDTQTDWYIDAREERQLVQTYGLLADARGTFVLRAVQLQYQSDKGGVTLDLVSDLMTEGVVLGALDSATSEDPRERGLATQVLDEALDRFRRNA